MNEARFKSLYEGLTGIAQKVYDAAPIAESWAIKQIHAELLRRGGNADYKTVSGCLRSLEQQKLVTEQKPGLFRRTGGAPTPKPKLVAQQGVPMPAAAKPVVAPKKRLAERIIDLAERTRSSAQGLRELADDLDLLALEADEELAANGAAAQKLRELQALLKGLS